jgi:hypothetical protein
MEPKRDDGGQAFPMIDVAIDGQAIGSAGMSLRQYAAIHLRVPDSGNDWLDDMIRNSNEENTTTKESPMVVLFQGDLRDYFAGQALAAWIASADAFNDECRERGSSTRIEADDTATSCYQYADAMLKARAE